MDKIKKRLLAAFFMRHYLQNSRYESIFSQQKLENSTLHQCEIVVNFSKM